MVNILFFLFSGQVFPTPVSPQYRTFLPKNFDSKWVTIGPPGQFFPAHATWNAILAIYNCH